MSLKEKKAGDVVAEEVKKKSQEESDNNILGIILSKVINAKEETQKRLSDQFAELEIEKIAHEINKYAFKNEAEVSVPDIDPDDDEAIMITLSMKKEKTVKKEKVMENESVLDLTLQAAGGSSSLVIQIHSHKAPKGSMASNFTEADKAFKVTKGTTADDLRKKIGTYLASAYDPDLIR